MKMPKLGLKLKIFLGLSILLTVSFLFLGGALYFQGLSLSKDELLETTKKRLDKDTLVIEHNVSSARQDLLVLTAMPPVQGIIRAQDNGGIDPINGDSLRAWSDRLEQIFKAFLKNRLEYYQLSYLDDEGREIVSVGRDKAGKKAGMGNRLQDQAQSPYFKNTIMLGESEIYYSDVNLQRDLSRIREPHTPMFRTATPVYHGRKARGIIIMQLYAAELLSSIVSGEEHIRKYIINQDGYFIQHPDRSKEFSFELGVVYTLAQHHPEIADALQSGNSWIKYSKNDQQIKGFKKVFFDRGDKGRYWAVIYEYPAEFAFSHIRETRKTMIVVSVFVAVFSVLMVLWAASALVIQPVAGLLTATQKISGGNLSIRVDEKQTCQDEIGELADAFNSMADSLENILSEHMMLAKSLDSSTDLIIISDVEGVIIHANPQVWNQVGYTQKDIKGKKFSVLQSLNNPPGLSEEIFRETLEGGWEGEVINVRSDGTEYYSYLTAAPVLNEKGVVTAVVGLSRDMTGRKAAEEKLKEYSEQLEQKVTERTAELERAKQFAETANKAKSVFLANMSHELRTPLNAIIGFSDLLADELSAGLNNSQKEYLSYIRESGNHLLKLINDILDLSKVESGKMVLEPSHFHIASVIYTTLSMLKEKAMKHRIELTCELHGDEDLKVEADERKLKQIVFNLASNAVKFTADGGSVRITAQKSGAKEDRQREYVEISVADTGIGIREEDMPNLFGEFVQLGSAYTKEYSGSGLGLALARKLVELHGGRIWAESELGKGSTFTFIIPVRQEGRSVAG